MSKKIVLKVDIAGEPCKTNAMSIVAKIPGIKSMAVDGEKGTLTVVGDVDVVTVASALRKAKFTAQVVSVGPEKVEEKKPEEAKKPGEKKADDAKKAPPPPCCCSGACSCYRPGQMPMAPYPGTVVCYDEPSSYGCVIL